MTNDIKNQIEALLFASGRKMTLDELKMHLNVSSSQTIRDAFTELQKEYEQRESPVMLVEEGDSWKLTTREKYLTMVRKINPNTELTKTMMETLAVIAWKQPITQSEVIAIRTNKAYEHIGALERMGFLVKEKYGRTYMLKLTEKFYTYFDLRDAQAARDMFKHIKEDAETQRKLEEARTQADASAAGQKIEPALTQETTSLLSEPSLPAEESLSASPLELSEFPSEDGMENSPEQSSTPAPLAVSIIQGYEKAEPSKKEKSKKGV